MTLTTRHQQNLRPGVVRWSVGQSRKSPLRRSERVDQTRGERGETQVQKRIHQCEKEKGRQPLTTWTASQLRKCEMALWRAEGQVGTAYSARYRTPKPLGRPRGRADEVPSAGERSRFDRASLVSGRPGPPLPACEAANRVGRFAQPAAFSRRSTAVSRAAVEIVLIPVSTDWVLAALLRDGAFQNQVSYA